MTTAPIDKHPRLPSLDALRGLTIVGMMLVNASAALSFQVKVFPILLHKKWAGFTAADAVFPAFIVMVGVSIAISTKPDRPLEVKAILGRTIRLILLGLVLVNMYMLLAPDQFTFRLPGVLQRIGIVYAAAAVLYPRLGLRARAVLAAAILLVYWPLCLIPQPDDIPTDLWAPGQNFASWTDRALFGRFVGERGPMGFDPEGALSTLPALAQCLIGTVAGDVLRRGRGVLPLLGAGVALITGGLAWGLAFPIVKSYWTSSFVLLSSGIALVLLATFHSLMDGKESPTRRVGLFGSFGRNAIGAYALHLCAIIFLGSLMAPYHWLAPHTGSEIAALSPVALFIAIVWVPFAIMDSKGKYLKI